MYYHAIYITLALTMSYETFRDKQKMRINVTNLVFTMTGFIANTCFTAQMMMIRGIRSVCCERSRISASALVVKH